MSVLRVYLPAESVDAEWRWALSSGLGAVLREGDGDEPPPPADDCELVLAAGLCRFAEPSLPPGAARQGESVLGFALEEGLLNAPEENRYSLQSTGRAPQVCLTAQAPLRRIMASLSAAGQSVTRIVPEELCLPEPPADGWTLARLDSGWALRLGYHRALCVPLLGDALWHDLRAWASPAQILLCGDAPLPAALQDLPVTHRARPDWRTAAVDPAYDFAAGRRRWRQFGRQWLRIARQAGMALLALALLDLTLSAGELGWLRWQQWRMVDGMTEAAGRMGVRQAVGEDVLNQARRQLAVERTRHGLAQDGDFLPMLVALQPALTEQGALRRLRYRHGELTVEGETLPAEVAPAQRSRLAAQGWTVTVPAPGQVTLLFAPVRREGARP
ncbi:type II secretion system protein GspL [Paludibacterium purpuratum]|uniref:General secretion pathway protein L n=1 Tax=Paludibacterium purpuratum TaxID=1144873 RepID=A0A4R7AUR6_9NEIS|nr:type II secretion system protein GspL [Paludibacterium purpuratum]TDR70747.1 general secretion pathway protein L [Paludibacterium purpuratum]